MLLCSCWECLKSAGSPGAGWYRARDRFMSERMLWMSEHHLQCHDNTGSRLAAKTSDVKRRVTPGLTRSAPGVERSGWRAEKWAAGTNLAVP